MIRQDRLLCSINDRLGGGPGEDLPPLDDTWMGEIVAIASDRAERLNLERPDPEDS